MLKKITLLTSGIILLALIFFYRVSIREAYDNFNKEPLPQAISLPDTNEPVAPPSIAVGEPKPSIPEKKVETPPALDEMPVVYNLDVPFQSQAPTSDWSMPYQEACEEASLIMADAFYNKTSLTVAEMDERIKKLVDWETKKFGYYEDTTAAEVVIIAKEYFGLEAKVDSDVSVANIKKYLSQNKLVLVPAAGKILPNPNFKNGGPLYHMLVIRGYTTDKFITNDPGTRLGKEFVYTYDALTNAIHDWPEGQGKDDVTQAEILQGRKVIIVVDK